MNNFENNLIGSTFRENSTGVLCRVKLDSCDYFGDRRIIFVFNKGKQSQKIALFDKFIEHFEVVKYGVCYD